MSKRKSYSREVNAAVGSSKKKMVTTPENDNKSKAMAERMKAIEDNAQLITLANERLSKQNQKLNANNYLLEQQIINLNNRISAMQTQIEILKKYNDEYTLEIGKLNRILQNGSNQNSAHNTGSSGMEVEDYKKIIKW